jgi:hypothetical protein
MSDQRWEQLKELIGEIWYSHCDQTEWDYNECETKESQCAWCEETKALVKELDEKFG